VDGVTTHDWINISGVEGVGVLSDPNDTTALYNTSGGWIRLYDRVLRTTTSIGTDIPKEITRAIVHPTPMASSPSRPRTMYIGFDRVLRSDDRGYHWRTLSPALVRVVDTITLMANRWRPSSPGVKRRVKA